MADIVIRNVDLQKVKKYMSKHGCMFDSSVVFLPEGHGRLIDADALKKKSHWTDDFYETEYVEVEDIDTADTIVPAEGGGEDG